jgi:hypothetical protein
VRKPDAVIVGDDDEQGGGALPDLLCRLLDRTGSEFGAVRNSSRRRDGRDEGADVIACGDAVRHGERPGFDLGSHVAVAQVREHPGRNEHGERDHTQLEQQGLRREAQPPCGAAPLARGTHRRASPHSAHPHGESRYRATEAIPAWNARWD